MPEYSSAETIDTKKVLYLFRRKDSKLKCDPTNLLSTTTENHLDSTAPLNKEAPEGFEPWREKLAQVLKSTDPFGFERLAQRVLRECGFSQVEVTKKSGDGGIDGTGKLKINGIFSFNVAFQCKRHKETTGASDIRDFRGSLTTNIEKGVFITTGIYTKAAIEEASSPGKQQIDLIDGTEFINKLIECEIGVHPVITYEVDEDFFRTI